MKTEQTYQKIMEELLYQYMCKDCEREHCCHNNCENCEEYGDLYENGYIKVSEHSVHIGNSFLFTNDSDKCRVLHQLFNEYPQVLKHRSAQSFINEWKAHNILYQKDIEQERTKDVDFELKQKWYLKIAYWFIAHFGKEKE